MSSPTPKVAVVTGSNKGIGFYIVRGLCKLLPGATVILTSRQVAAGEEAVKKLKDEGLVATSMQLDITDKESISKFVEEVKTKHGGIDVLVNNAGFAFKQAATETFAEQAPRTMAVNYFGTLNFSNAAFPLLRPNARVVNVASMTGSMAYRNCSEDIKKEFANPQLTEEQLTDLVNRFIKDAGGDDKARSKWHSSTYGMSKLAVLALTNIQARAAPTGTLVNACCPGWCKSDMAGWQSPPKTAEQGADTPIFLATLPKSSEVTGKYYSERQEQTWDVSMFGMVKYASRMYYGSFFTAPYMKAAEKQ